MKKFMQTIQTMLADAALLEMDVATDTASVRKNRESSETLEENLIEVAFAEEADFDQIHDAILWEHRNLGVCHT